MMTADVQTQPSVDHTPGDNLAAVTPTAAVVAPVQSFKYAPTGHAIRPAKIMIVDDEPVTIMIVQKYLKDVGYGALVTTSDPSEAIAMMVREEPDLAIFDVVMPQINGLDLLTSVRCCKQLEHTPIIILTASTDAGTKLLALDRGATDVLAKPVDPSELVLRIRNTLVVKAHRDSLEGYAKRLEGDVRRRTADIEAARREAILCLARMAEYRDEQTECHVLRVGMYAGIIAAQLGMSAQEIESLREASQLHDVGKIGVADSILRKPGKLDPDEYALMQEHCECGWTIIEPSADKEWQLLQKHAKMGCDIMRACTSPIMQLAAIIAETHHERWDGTGYPRGLRGEEIPLPGRIASVADVYDALNSRRPYRDPLPHEECLTILEEGRGTQFDPRVLDAFFDAEQSVLAVVRDYAEND